MLRVCQLCLDKSVVAHKLQPVKAIGGVEMISELMHKDQLTDFVSQVDDFMVISSSCCDLLCDKCRYRALLVGRTQWPAASP